MGFSLISGLEQMRKKDLPTISVVTATYNSAQTLDRCLMLVRKQDYPQKKIEIVLGDGGSTDNTLKIAQKYKARVIKIPKEKQNAEYNRGMAFNNARNELVLILDHDNFLPYKTWLKDMVRPLLENPKMVATETCYYDYNRQYKLMDRYYALFGTSEPLPYYLGKADRLPQTAKAWINLGKAYDRGDYYLVKFEKNPLKIPTIGTNGCLMRRKIILENADARPEFHYPIDIMIDVIKKGYNQFGFVKNSIIHLTNLRGFWPFLKRRLIFVEKYHFQNRSRRRYSVFMKGDEWKLAKYVFYSLTLIKPSWDALKGWMRIPDIAWFIHPFLCLGTTLVYGYMILKNKVVKSKEQTWG